jgi:hypothetical protein
LLIQFLVIIGILFGGLMAAQKMGIYGAEGAISIAKGIGKRTTKWGGRLGMRTALKIAAPPRKIKKPGKKEKIKGGWVQRGLAKVAKNRLVGKLATPVIHGLEQARAAVAKQQESIKEWTSEHLADTFNQANAEGKVARMLQLYENDDLDKLSESQLRKGLRLAQRYGQESKLVKALPRFAEEIGKSVQDTINKTSPTAAAKIAPDYLNKETLEAIANALKSGQWTSAHLGKIASENPALRAVIQDKIMTKENVQIFAPHVKNYLGSYLGNSLYGVPPEWLEEKEPRIIPGSKYGPVK